MLVVLAGFAAEHVRDVLNEIEHCCRWRIALRAEVPVEIELDSNGFAVFAVVGFVACLAAT